MPDSIVKGVIREIEPLSASEPVGSAARKVIEADLPSLPVIDEEGRFAGIFGEREFMHALFPGYVGTLSSSAMISAPIDATIERRLSCREEPTSGYMTTDHVLVEDDYSATPLAHQRNRLFPLVRRWVGALRSRGSLRSARSRSACTDQFMSEL